MADALPSSPRSALSGTSKLSQHYIAALTLLPALTLVAVGGVVWERRRVAVLQAQVSQLIEADRTGAMPSTPRPTPAYDASARQFLGQRSAGWAPMLRTLESGAMIGVTPSSVEFNAADGVARITVNYADSTALLEYLGRINEGVSPGQDRPRWMLVEARIQAPAQLNVAAAGLGLS